MHQRCSSVFLFSFLSEVGEEIRASLHFHFLYISTFFFCCRTDAQRAAKVKENKEKELEHCAFNAEQIEDSNHAQSLVRINVRYFKVKIIKLQHLSPKRNFKKISPYLSMHCNDTSQVMQKKTMHNGRAGA